MEGDKRADSYSSPFDALFGPKGSPPSSTSAVLADIFPPKEVSGGDASPFDVGCKKQGSASETLSAKTGSSVGSFKTKECECKGFCISKENVSPFINHEQKPHPSYLSSSIFYGGQEHYPTPRNSKSSDQFKKDGAEDAGETSKNWWKGGVYY